MKRKDVNMLSGSITRGLLSISLPIMVMNIIQSLFNIIDMSILKTYDTSNGLAVGAVGVCGTLITLITSLVIGVSTGANVIIARNIGRGDPDSVDRSIGSAMAFPSPPVSGWASSASAAQSCSCVGITARRIWLLRQLCISGCILLVCPSSWCTIFVPPFFALPAIPGGQCCL